MVPIKPVLRPTYDSKVISGTDVLQNKETPYLKDIIAWMAPILSEELHLPVSLKIQLGSSKDVWPLFSNKQGDCLGIFVAVNEGRIFLLPQYKDNEYVISLLLNRVLPRFLKQPTRTDIINLFSSPAEREATQEIDTIELERKTLDERFEQARENLVSARREKRHRIENDETARRLLVYYQKAVQDEEAALFYLFKVTDALKNHYGGAVTARQKLETDADWRLIGERANASYGDTRHAPNPGEKIKEWSKEEVDECYSAAQRIINSYLPTLF